MFCRRKLDDRQITFARTNTVDEHVLSPSEVFAFVAHGRPYGDCSLSVFVNLALVEAHEVLDQVGGQRLRQRELNRVHSGLVVL